MTMDESSDIEKLIARSVPQVPEELRSRVLQTIRVSSRQQTRRDDFVAFAKGMFIVFAVSLLFLGTLSVQHSLLMNLILSAN